MTDLALHPGGRKLFALCNGNQIFVYDLDTKAERLVLKSGVMTAIALSSDGSHLLIGCADKVRECTLTAASSSARVDLFLFLSFF